MKHDNVRVIRIILDLHGVIALYSDRSPFELYFIISIDLVFLQLYIKHNYILKS